MIKYYRDIVPLESCRNIISGNLELYFTKNELETFKRESGLRSLSARYELKRLTLIHFSNKIKFTDIEILNNDFGKPELKIINYPKIFEKENIIKISCSLSHSRNYIATIVAVEIKG